MVFFSSDFHLGHKNIIKYRPQFSSIEEHDNAIFNICSKLTKRDDLFVLGDIMFDSEHFDRYLSTLAKMPCKFKFILGNHCSTKLYTQTIASNIKILPPLVSYKSFWLSHCPIHPQELRSRILNIHGHLHNHIVETRVLIDSPFTSTPYEELIPDTRYFNVNLDNNDFKLVTLEHIKAHAERLK